MESPPSARRVARAGRPGPHSTALAIAALVLLALALVLYALGWNSGSAGFLSDDAVYLLMADGMRPFGSADPALTAYVMRQTIFPPLYPLLLAVLGGGSATLLWAHVITTTTLVLALAVYGLWIHVQVRDAAAAIALLAIFALLPATLFQDLEILSEFPYLLLSLLALWQTERAGEPERGLRWAALCVGLATVTRTAGLSLLAAFALWLLRRRPRGWLKWLAIALVPSVAWLAYRKWVAPGTGGYASFWSSLWERMRDHPGYAAVFVENQGKGLWQALLNTLDLGPTHLTQAILGITLLAAVPVFAYRLWRWRLDAWYLLIGGMMVFLYPFPSYFTRLFLPWVPIVLFYAYCGVRAATAGWARIATRPALADAYLAALFLTLLPSLGFIGQRFTEPVDPGLANWKHTRYWYRPQDMGRIRADVRFRQNLIDALRETGQQVAPGDCVYGVHTAVAMLYSRRIFQQPPPPAASAAEFEAGSKACGYYLLMPLAAEIGAQRVAAFYPNDRLAAAGMQRVRVWEDPADPDVPTAVLLRSKPTP